MRIVAIDRQECLELLNRVSFGRLACTLDDQPYVVPIRFVYEADSLYLFSTLGQKIEWMRKNPKVCVQADELGSRASWISVVVTGKYLELKEPQDTAEIEHAKELLRQDSQWWETPLAERRERAGDLSVVPIFFRIEIESMSGLRSIPEKPH